MKSAKVASIVMVVAACASPVSSPLPTMPPATAGMVLPTYEPGGGAYPAALATGTIEIKGSCVVLRDTMDHVLIWPSGTSAHMEGGSIVVASPAGPTLREHQQVSVGGGEFTVANFPRSITGLNDECRDMSLWLAAPGWT
jgi:hypothetical protein